MVGSKKKPFSRPATLARLPPESTSAPASIAREIRLVVREMTYYVEGEHTPNPTLHVRRGGSGKMRTIAEFTFGRGQKTEGGSRFKIFTRHCDCSHADSAL